MNPYIEQANQQFVPVYNRYPIVLDHGEGMYLYDTEEKRYLDLGSGIGDYRNSLWFSCDSTVATVDFAAKPL